MRLAAILALLGAPAEACRLALVLALDVSSSVDGAEDALQRRGLARALLAPDVQAAVFAAPDPVALYVFEWSGRWDQVPITPDWVVIETPEDLERVAARVEASRRDRADMPTALGYALGHAAVALGRAPGCTYATIDVSSDGENNEGFPPGVAFGAFDFDEVTVNALVVGGANGSPGLMAYYRTQVLRGPGAFAVEAFGYGDYARAMERKLVRELAPRAVGLLEAGGVAG